MLASGNDWIIRGIQGEIYPCSPDIFAAIYDPVADDEDGGAQMKTPGSTYNLSSYRVTAESMVNKEGWPMWMFRAFESKSLALSINGQYWELSDRADGTRAIPWGYYLTRVACCTTISIVGPEVFQDANYTREAEPDSAGIDLSQDPIINEQVPIEFTPVQSREAWIRDAALRMKCADIAAGLVGSESAPVVCVARAREIYDAASKRHKGRES